MSVVIKVLEGHSFPQSRQAGDKTFWYQEVYMDTGGPFPEKSKLSIPGSQNQVIPGDYHIGSGAYRIGKYGDIEINAFELYKYLTPVAGAQAVKPVADKKAG